MLGVSLAAAVVDGLLAGGNVDRAIVARAAWRHVGLVGWAEYSRYADLGNGQLFYPAMAFGGTILSVLAAITFLKARRTPRRAGWPVFAGAILMLVCLPISFRAAPFIMNLRRISNEDLGALRGAFDGSFYWGRLQMLLHVAAFAANLWAVARLTGTSQTGAKQVK